MLKHTTKGAATRKVVFPGIAAWLTRNNMTVNGLARCMGYEHGACTPVYYVLYGMYDPTLHMVKKILAATGMTFEEAFGGVEHAEA